MKHLAIIIPFYQKKSGLLRNSINSILLQSDIDNIRITIIIIDDESPINAEKELKNLEKTQNIEIKIINQKNSGPAKARNVGLDFADSLNVDYIAFLDSDDIWHDDHISRAMFYLNKSSDFYFCDHQRFDNDYSYFVENPYINDYVNKNKVKQSLIIEIKAKVFFINLIETYFCQTSTIVFSRKILNGLRFDETLTVAGEDHLMWLHLISQCNLVTMDLKSGVDYGEGVNIFTSSNDWGTSLSIKNNFDQFSLFLKMNNEFILDNKVKKFVKYKMDEKFSFYSYLTVKFALKFEFIGFKLLFNSELPKVSTFFKIIYNFFYFIIVRPLK
ncbi:glycosyltransferase family A protein [Shewanella sp. TB7-MNA-CIBAN-0143]|jgi:succinoglycan biosynthesis protein ExoW|uniref:glycosyltransferase family A protein n=1 Tax=unclassified Shewanella TaxID=196818 RepID=UPI00332CC18A